MKLVATTMISYSFSWPRVIVSWIIVSLMIGAVMGIGVGLLDGGEYFVDEWTYMEFVILTAMTAYLTGKMLLFIIMYWCLVQILFKSINNTSYFAFAVFFQGIIVATFYILEIAGWFAQGPIYIGIPNSSFSLPYWSKHIIFQILYMLLWLITVCIFWYMALKSSRRKK